MSERQTMVKMMERGKARSSMMAVILSVSERWSMNWK